MKRILIMAFLFTMLAQVSLAEETLMCGGMGHGGSDGMHHGMSIGPTVKFTSFNGKFAVLAGGQIGMTLDQSFMIGGAMYGLATEHHPSTVPVGYLGTPDETFTQMSYGGMVLSYIGLAGQVLHPTFDLLIGGGEVRQDWNDDQWRNWNANGYYPHHHNGDGFFVVEPTVNAEINVAPFMRADVGAGYRVVSGISEWGLSNSDVGGPTASVALKFGKF